jgi:hypothetical protein
MSICESCSNYKRDFMISDCKNKKAYNQLMNRAVFHEERTRNYQPEFKQLDPIFAFSCAISELKNCKYYHKKLFQKITESDNFTHRDIKDIFEIV